MNIQTQCTDRREMVKRISEHLQMPAVYLRVPSCAYRIGRITVNKDASITGDEEQITALLPFLKKCGYTSDEQTESAFTASLGGWTIPQTVNLIRLLCSRQHLIRRMLQLEEFHIEASFAESITANPPETHDDLEARLKASIHAECIRGVSISNGVLHIPLSADSDPDTANTLLARLLTLAQSASRIRLITCDPESEKYAAHALLMQLGLNGAKHRQLRSKLTAHLTGYAAFKSEADMQAHKARQAQLRRSRREAVQA